MNVLGLITARGQSKSIPRKNIAPLAGRPLLAYTCEAAKTSASLSRVVLSTDDEEIARVGRDYGAETPFLRPLELAGDATPSIDVALHALQWLADREGWKADALVLLQPTSPLRTSRHIDEAFQIWRENGADTVVSVMETPHRFSPFSIMKLQDGCLKDFWDQPLPFDRFRRQNHPRLYARNGPAVLISRSSVLFEKKSFYGERVYPYVMDEKSSVDIDTLFDLHMAEWLLTQ